MSGGKWDYIQYRFTDIAEDIDSVIEKNGKVKSKEQMKEDSWRDEDWYDKYPEDRYHYEYPEEVLEKLKEAAKAIRIAQIYAQRVDWLLSGDDGEESFLRRLEEELKK